MTLAHYYGIRQDLHSPQSDYLPSPSLSPFLEAISSQQTLQFAHSSLLPPPLDLSYSGPDSDAYIIDSRQSTPYDYDCTFNPLPDAQQYMTNNFSPDPRLPFPPPASNNGLSSAVTPPPMNEGSNWVQPSWNDFSDPSYLRPQVQQYGCQQAFRSHKRLSSGSSIASAGPDSPYTQTQTYPHIVDLDSHAASSPHLEPYDTSFQPAQQFAKPISAPSNALHGASLFHPAFQNLNISSNDAVSITAGQNALRQVMSQQNASNMNAAQRNARRSFGGMDGSMAIQSEVPKLDRTVSDVYQDELFDSSIESSVPVSQPQQLQQHQQQQQYNNASQGQLLSPTYRPSVFNDRVQQANTARSVSPSNTVSRERSPFRDDSEFAVQQFASANAIAPATTRLKSAASMREQQKLRADAEAYAQHHPHPVHHSDFGTIAPKTISPKEALLDYDESSADDSAKISALPQIKRESDFSSAHAATSPFVRGKTNNTRDGQNSAHSANSADTPTNAHINTHAHAAVGNGAQNYVASVSSDQRRQTPNLSSPQHSSASGFTFMPPSVPTSGPPQQYPFISQSRRQSSSMRSAQSDQVPDFPASLTSMESTRSDSTQEQNLRPPTLSSQDTFSSQCSDGASSIRRPSDTTANSGTYTCTSLGCAARFDSSSKLQKHRRDNHGVSPHHFSSPTTPTSSTTHQRNSQAAVNNVSRNNAPGPHKCVRTNPSTGKPCNTIFSRSYDLTRHEDTIHNNRKMKVRCHLCTEEKTFSRNDALTRHMRVVHPEVEYPGRNRRRG